MLASLLAQLVFFLQQSLRKALYDHWEGHMTKTKALRLVGALALAAVTFSSALPSYSDGRWQHRDGWGGGRNWGGDGRGWGDHGGCRGCGVAGALFGLAAGAALGGALSGEGPSPAYAGPPGVYYPPPQSAYPPPAVYYGDDDD
jgi:hypothetical protein